MRQLKTRLCKPAMLLAGSGFFSLTRAAETSNCTVNGIEQDCPAWMAAAGYGFGIFWLLFILWAFVFWIYMLVHLLKSDMPDSEKLVWVIVILFASLIGAIIYYFLVKRKNIP